MLLERLTFSRGRFWSVGAGSYRAKETDCRGHKLALYAIGSGATLLFDCRGKLFQVFD